MATEIIQACKEDRPGDEPMRGLVEALKQHARCVHVAHELQGKHAGGITAAESDAQSGRTNTIPQPQWQTYYPPGREKITTAEEDGPGAAEERACMRA